MEWVTPGPWQRHLWDDICHFLAFLATSPFWSVSSASAASVAVCAKNGTRTGPDRNSEHGWSWHRQLACLDCLTSIKAKKQLSCVWTQELLRPWLLPALLPRSAPAPPFSPNHTIDSKFKVERSCNLLQLTYLSWWRSCIWFSCYWPSLTLVGLEVDRQQRLKALEEGRGRVIRRSKLLRPFQTHLLHGMDLRRRELHLAASDRW